MERHSFLSRLGGYPNFAQHHASYKDLPRHNTNVEHGMVAVGEISDDKEVFVLVRQAFPLSSTLKISENLYHSTCAAAKYLYIKRFKENLCFDDNFYLECSPQLVVDHLVVPIGEHVSCESAAY